MVRWTLGGADIPDCLKVGQTFLSVSNPRVGAFLPSERIRIRSGGQECPPLTNSMTGKNACPTLETGKNACPTLETGKNACPTLETGKNACPFLHLPEKSRMP